MKFESLYRISLYLLLFLSSLILNIDSDAAVLLGGSNVRYARFFPLVMALASVIAFLFVDRKPGRGLGPGSANLLGVASLMLVYLEYRIDPNQLVLACGHWLFYLALVKMFRPKDPEDDWYLIVLGLMQVLVGCFLSQGDRVGVLLVLWAILALWVLSLFYLHREALRSGTVAPREGVGPKVDRDAAREPYPGLFGLPFYLSTAQAAAMTLLLGVFIFLIMPRSDAKQQAPRGAVSPRSLTGFSDEVRLGQMGEILENNAVVFTAELLIDGRRVRPDEELLWRGVTLTSYRDGRWRRQRNEIQAEAPPASRRGAPTLIEQRIRMEETSERVLFALRPILRLDGPVELIDLNATDGTLIREVDNRARRLLGGRRNNGPLNYVVFSEYNPGGIPTQPGENDIIAFSSRAGGMLEIPDELVAPLGEISDRVVAGIPSDDLVSRARALEAYLRDSGEFHYTLQMLRGDTTIDPNLDFLLNTRRGHCEYFASALALLLRSQGIPSRVVNGFKGGDWNDLAQMLTVRQRHAHSWVEAYVGFTPDNNRLPLWLPLDPAPAAEQAEQVAQVGGLPTSLRQLADFVRYVWVFYVAGFNADRQEQLLYEPIRALVKEAREGFRIMRLALLNALRWLTDFPSPTSFFSVRGFIASFLVMLLTVGLVGLARRLWRLLGRRIGGGDDLAGDPSGALAAYVRLVRVLEEYGLQRPATETPREFARRASVLLGDRALDADGRPLADVPGRVVEAFYRVRYGALPLAVEVVAELDHQIDALEAGLRPSPG